MSDPSINRDAPDLADLTPEERAWLQAEVDQIATERRED